MLSRLGSEAEQSCRRENLGVGLCLAFCDMETTERVQLRPGVELAGKECEPLGGGRKGNKWKETGLCWMPGSS